MSKIMFSINQSLFSFQDGVCWLASSINMMSNNILKHKLTDSEFKDIERYCISEHKFPMGNSGSPVGAGIKRVQGYLEKYHNKKGKSSILRLGTKTLESYLNKGMCVAIAINSSKEFGDMRQSGDTIKGDFTNAKDKSGHWICLFKDKGEYYFLNSWYGDNRDIKKVDMLVKGLFKDDIVTVLY